MKLHRHRCALAGALMGLLAAGCHSETSPRLYRTSPLPPPGLVAPVPPSMYDLVDEGVDRVEVTEADIVERKHLGPTLLETAAGEFRGVNFGVFSERAEKMRLLLFDDPEASRATREIEMTRHGDVWNVYVEGVGIGQHYGYVAWGPNWTFDERWYPGSIHGFHSDVDNEGNRFNPNKLLFDPYCKAFHRDHDWSKGSAGTGPHRIQSTHAAAMKCVIVQSRHQWSEQEEQWRAGRRDGTLEGHGDNDLILYEVHPKGFTANSSSGVKHPGTFRGFGEKAGYLKDLGITAVELLPPYEKSLDAGYWGYNTLSFFAPELSYSSRRHQHEVIDEFKWMVEQLHAHGIEVIVDVVFNHTGEGGLWREKVFPRHLLNQDPNQNNGPWNLDPEETASLFSYRGLDNASYYALPPGGGREYCDYTGVGNTVRCNNPPVKRLILDSLRYWVEELHVDGFRFDLAPALGAKDLTYDGCPTSARSGGGIYWDPLNSVLQEIINDPVLQKNNTRIIAEPWGGGGHPTGKFPVATNREGYGWGEWNDRFRDWWRRFVNQDDWVLNSAHSESNGGSLITGSEPIFKWNKRAPLHSANFITVHDGMTMYDLVSYDQKVNACSPLNPICCTAPMSAFCDEAQKGGTNDNWSRNWGDESFKRQLMRNFFASMLISHGTPLLFGGDEWMRTQLGNNNTYTPEADNPWSWHDWGAWEAKDERVRMFDFVRKLIQFRKDHAYALAPIDYGKGAPFAWKNAQNAEMSVADWGGRHLMIHYYDGSKGPQLAILINMETGPVTYTLPGGVKWKRVVDTQQHFDSREYLAEKKLSPKTSGNIDLERAPEVPSSYEVKSRSIVILEAR